MRANAPSDNRCPFCAYTTPEPADGDAYARGWQEVAHMTVTHPDVIAGRLRDMGMHDDAARFESCASGGEPHNQ